MLMTFELLFTNVWRKYYLKYLIHVMQISNYLIEIDWQKQKTKTFGFLTDYLIKVCTRPTRPGSL